MNKWDRQFLGTQARELGFVRDTYEKVCRLTEILKFFQSDDLLGRTLALKGGTAINLTIFNLPRLSVDIDLDFCENVSREEMMAARVIVNERIKKYMKANDYLLSKKSKQYHALDSFIYDYTNSGGMKDNIKIEINYMLRTHILGVGQRRFESTWEPAGVLFLSVAPIEIFGSKIVALIGRAAARDLYDVYNLVKYGLFDKSEEDLLRKCVVFYSAVGTELPPSEYSLESIDAITEKLIKRDLRPVLRSRDKFDLKIAQVQVKDWLLTLLNIQDNEREFLELFRSKEYQPELLFESKDILNRIQNHPMALWKCSRE